MNAEQRIAQERAEAEAIKNAPPASNVPAKEVEKLDEEEATDEQNFVDRIGLLISDMETYNASDEEEIHGKEQADLDQKFITVYREAQKFSASGDLAQAMESYEKALELGFDKGRLMIRRGWAASLFSTLGMFQMKLGNVRAAIDCFQKGGALAEQEKDLPTIILVCNKSLKKKKNPNPQSSTLNPQSSTLKPQTSNLKPQTKKGFHRLILSLCARPSPLFRS